MKKLHNYFRFPLIYEHPLAPFNLKRDCRLVHSLFVFSSCSPWSVISFVGFVCSSTSTWSLIFPSVQIIPLFPGSFIRYFVDLSICLFVYWLTFILLPLRLFVHLSDFSFVRSFVRPSFCLLIHWSVWTFIVSFFFFSLNLSSIVLFTRSNSGLPTSFHMCCILSELTIPKRIYF